MKVVQSITKPVSHPEPVTNARKASGPASCFVVAGGIPLGSAFDDMSVLLDAASNAIECAAMSGSDDGEPSPLWSAFQNLQLAYSLLQAMHSGYLAHRKEVEAQA